MPVQSLARIMYGSSQEYSLAVATNAPVLPRTHLSSPEDTHSVREPESIADLLSKAWARIYPKH
ncbi:MAG TPA: hypothetical protein VMH20_18655 [Verrucomicrobiae bacterium]|nr:hypothetical protein [Verrucomicrobiae bacterium]